MRKPLIIAHNGSALESLRHVNVVELDIRATADQILVINHADRLSLLKGTKISKLTYAELVERGYQPLKMEDFVKDLPENIGILLDLKNTTIDLALDRMIKRLKHRYQIIVNSNDLQALNRYMLYFPAASFAYSTGYMYDPFNFSFTRVGRFILFVLPALLSYPMRLITRRKVNRILPEYISIYSGYCKPSEVSFYHTLGVKVQVFVVNKEENMRKFIAMGVDGIITDKPELLWEVINSRR